jgi:hypothetical protein
VVLMSPILLGLVVRDEVERGADRGCWLDRGASTAPNEHVAQLVRAFRPLTMARQPEVAFRKRLPLCCGQFSRGHRNVP